MHDRNWMVLNETGIIRNIVVFLYFRAFLLLVLLLVIPRWYRKTVSFMSGLYHFSFLSFFLNKATSLFFFPFFLAGVRDRVPPALCSHFVWTNEPCWAVCNVQSRENLCVCMCVYIFVSGQRKKVLVFLYLKIKHGLSVSASSLVWIFSVNGQSTILF